MDSRLLSNRSAWPACCERHGLTFAAATAPCQRSRHDGWLGRYLKKCLPALTELSAEDGQVAMADDGQVAAARLAAARPTRGGESTARLLAGHPPQPAVGRAGQQAAAAPRPIARTPCCAAPSTSRAAAPSA